jgi:sugar phosphate isomerase/epimerase
LILAVTIGWTLMSGACAAPSEPLKLACRLANYGDYQEAAWTHLPSLGAKYVFMNVPRPDQVEEVQKRLTDHGLAALVLRGEVDFKRTDAVDALADQAAVCERMGVKYMFLSVKGRWPDKQVIYERLRRAGDAAKKHGVTLAIETHPELGTNGDVLLETMKGVHHPNVRVNFDTGNITYYNRNTDAVTELQKIIDYVATVEIKDHSAQFETWNFPPLGRGAVDIPGVLRVLREHGFTGPITIEVEGVENVKRDQAQIQQDIAESFAYLRKLGRFE